MFASPLYHQKPGTGKAHSTFLKYLSQPTLAFVMFFALAVLSSIGGKESEPQKSTLSKDANGALVGRMMHAFRGAFNDPSLLEYANQLSTGTPDFPTTPPLSISSQQSTCSKSPSSQSRTSSVTGY